MDALTEAFDMLGITSDATFVKDAHSSECVRNDVKYTFDLSKDGETPRYILRMSKISNEQAENHVELIDADKLLNSMMKLADSPAFVSYLYDETSDSNGLLGKPDSYGSKVNFALASLTGGNVISSPTISVEQGGYIEVFYSTSAAIARYNKLASYSYFGFPSTERLYLNKNALLRLSGDLPEREAAALASAFFAVE